MIMRTRGDTAPLAGPRLAAGGARRARRTSVKGARRVGAVRRAAGRVRSGRAAPPVARPVARPTYLPPDY
ncbi:unnamed protein product, partial [Brenthis ino]